MCGRMTLTRSGDEIAAYFALEMAAEEEDGGALRTRFNIAPSQGVLTVVQSARQPELPLAPHALLAPLTTRRPHWKTWGLIPSWAKDPKRGGSLFNARSETVDVKPSFRSAWKRRRCLVVADGFYEWSPRNKGHQPYYFSAQSGGLLGMAGLFEEWVDGGSSSDAAAKATGSGEVIESCTVLTTEANSDLEEVHHRMPVLLHPDQFGAWLDPDADPDALKSLLVPASENTLARFAVSDYVNSPRNDDPACLQPPPPPKPPAPPAQPDLFSFDTSSGDESS